MICLIPAKSHSSRLPGKNLERKLGGANGKTLLQIAVERALIAGVFAMVVVSTDRPDAVSRQVGRAPSLSIVSRPSSLCQWDSTDQGWVDHAIGWLRLMDQDLAMILRPTSPFFGPDLIKQAVEDFGRHIPGADSMRPVRPVEEHPGKMWRVQEGGTMFSLVRELAFGYCEPYNQPTQSLPKCYVQTGAMEIFWLSLLSAGTHSGNQIVPYIVDDPEANLDINTLHDWEEAERIWEHRGGKCYDAQT